MLTQPTIDKLNTMKLTAMAKAFIGQIQSPDMASLSFEERFALLVDYQMTDLENRRMHYRLKNARLRMNACLEDLDFKQARGLDRAVVMSLAAYSGAKRPPFRREKGHHSGEKGHRSGENGQYKLRA